MAWDGINKLPDILETTHPSIMEEMKGSCCHGQKSYLKRFAFAVLIKPKRSQPQGFAPSFFVRALQQHAQGTIHRADER